MAEDVNGPEIEEESEAGKNKKSKKIKKTKVKKEKVKKEKVKKEKVKKEKVKKPRPPKGKKAKKSDVAENPEGADAEQIEVELIPIKKALSIIIGCALFSVAFLSVGVFAGILFIKPIVNTEQTAASANKSPKKSSATPSEYFGTPKDTSGGPVPGYPNLSWVSPEMKTYYQQLNEENSSDEHDAPQLDSEEAALDSDAPDTVDESLQ